MKKAILIAAMMVSSMSICSAHQVGDVIDTNINPELISSEVCVKIYEKDRVIYANRKNHKIMQIDYTAKGYEDGSNKIGEPFYYSGDPEKSHYWRHDGIDYYTTIHDDDTVTRYTVKDGILTMVTKYLSNC